ncbi:ribonuclease H [Trifolium pratense]|uniref:Ribonuclease H n=1 Tax=Trifolium pratense TaxID=57577 RepID=A0A2K3N4F2_TRIPR|nr:ribonuclease H [Trifolium pratense]
MDKLSHLIIHEVNNGKWKGIKAGRNGPMVSHLMFADDLLLFGEAKEEQMKCVIDTLNKFCTLSGQEVSQEKTSIYFSKNVSREMRNKLLRISGFKEANSMGRYLGVPLLGRAPKRNDFQYLVDQVETKLAGWKAKQLSFAGRVTLAKSVLEAIPIYPMMTTRIPKTCLSDIQRIQRSFIWGDTENGRKFHAVSWERVTTPKWMGGLGLRNLEYMNLACLIKLGWKIFSGADDYWCRIMRGKYKNDEARTTDSNLWKVIAGLKHHVWNNCKWIIGDGKDIDAWKHVWIEENLILEQHTSIPQDLQGARVCDLVGNDGYWNWNMLQDWMPANLRYKLAAILPPNAENGKDELAGMGGNCVSFSVSSMYQKLRDFNMDEEDPIWRNIWKLQVPERVRSFVWRVKWERLLTNSLKHRMGLTSAVCCFCGMADETILHALRDCSIVQQFWQQIVPQEVRGAFFMSSLQNWLHINVNYAGKLAIGGRWCDFWALACSCFWTWRNKELHGEKIVWPSNIIQHVRKLGENYRKALHTMEVVEQHESIVAHIHWKPPEGVFVKLNTDGASKAGNRAGCGGVIRGNQGEWLGGFAKGVGNCSAFVAELWGVLEGLLLVQRMGFENVELSIDSKAVVHVITAGKATSADGYAIVRKIRRLLLMDWNVKVLHEYREANKCADALANTGCILDLELIFYQECPMEIRNILLADELGISTPRIIVA